MGKFREVRFGQASARPVRPSDCTELSPVAQHGERLSGAGGGRQAHLALASRFGRRRGTDRLLFPDETDSAACRSPIPRQADHRFHAMPIAERPGSGGAVVNATKC